jgi:spore coat polysaccharide biosynthesis protein SpsF
MNNRIQKIVTIIQARMSSTRLPGKVMREVLGRPLLALMAERVMNSKLAGTVVIATTSGREDDVIEELCAAENLDCFRGDKDDLLDRHYKAAISYNADIVVKIPSDCPLIDSEVIDKVIESHIRNLYSYDYVSNLHPATYPDGNDVESITFSALHRAWKNACKDYELEHTTPYIWDNPGKFKTGNVLWETGLDYSNTHRWTLDYEEDYEFIRAVYEKLYTADKKFTLYDIIRLMEDRKEIGLINSMHLGVNWYRNHLNELKTIRV